MKPILVFDIETVPDIASVRLLNQLPNSLGDSEVFEFIAQKRRAQTGSDFMPYYLQRVVAISCCLRFQENSIHINTLGTVDSSEAEMIQKFFDVIAKYTPQLVSWNGGGFDLPVLHHRALILGIQAERYWDMGEGRLPDTKEFKFNNYINRYHNRHCDLMDVLAMYTGRANAPLDAMAKLCGFAGKLGMDGSSVWQAFQQGQLTTIRDYCETDVANTYLLYQRFRLMSGAIDREKYQFEIKQFREHLAQLATEKLHWQAFLQAWSID